MGVGTKTDCSELSDQRPSWFDTGSFDATVRLWDCKSQSIKPIQVLEESRDSVSSLHVYGYEIVTGSVDGRIRLYDLRKGMLLVDTIGRTWEDSMLISYISLTRYFA